MGDAKWGREPNREHSIQPTGGLSQRPGQRSRYPKGYTARRECPQLGRKIGERTATLSYT